jgi:uroporphyrinogen decarboxylase
MLHSDGAIRPFIPDLIECGIDLIDPVQPDCPGMELAGLKHDFGDKLSFHGGLDTHRVLPFGSPAEVRAATRGCIRDLGAGGGYILAPVHNVQGDVPPENLAAMCAAVRGEE